jgi:hypothetical protein
MNRKIDTVARLGLCLLASVIATPIAIAQAVPPAPPATHVMTVLTVKPTVQMADLAKVMPDEVRATVRLYLDGKIEQWYSLTEGKGVLFILNCSTAAEAKAMMDSLPLGKAQYADYKFTLLSPLAPLRNLLGPSPTQPAP